MIKKKRIAKGLSLFMAMALCAGNITPVTVKAEPATEERNVMAGLIPTTNADGGVLNPSAATDGNKSGSNVDSNNTKIVAGQETGTADNGYAQWQPVYLEYDLGKNYNLQKISLYRNTYDNAVSTFKDVKVEIATDKEFKDSSVVYKTADVEETTINKGQAQIIDLPEGTEGRYLRVWGKGHYIQNTNSSWKGYSNGVLFNEIEAIATVPVTEPEPEPNPDTNPDPENPGTGEELVDANIMLGLQPTTNSTHKIEVGDPTVPQVLIQNPSNATDGIKAGSNDDSNNTKIIAGMESGGGDNGYAGWDHVYLQYDFGKIRDVKQIDLYRNTYDAAVSDFKNVKVELSDTENFANGKNDRYYIAPESHTDGLMELSDGEESYESKNNFYYGGQPRYEASRVAVKEGDLKGESMRSSLKDGADLDFKIYTSADGEDWTRFKNVKIVDNFPEPNPSYARHTFDAYGLPEGTNYVKVEFPNYKGAEYTQQNGEVTKVKNTDIQLAKVTFLQEKDAAVPEPEPEVTLDSIKITQAPEKTEYVEGEIFDAKGMKVTAFYSDGTEKEVAEAVSYSKEPLQVTDKEIELSYTETNQADLPIQHKERKR